MRKRENICVLGGTGFVGQRVVSHLTSYGYNVRVLSRHRERHREMLLMPNVEMLNVDIHDGQALKENFKGQHAVINLVAVLNERSKSGASFQDVHVNLARKVIEACQVRGVERLVHMSALNANAKKGPSKYLRSKGEAEDIVHDAKELYVTSFQPSVIFGLHDSFFNRFAKLLSMSPGFLPFPLACANARFAPVYVEDVAAAIVASIDNPQTHGQRYSLCGPKEYTLKQLVRYTAELANLKRTIMPLWNSLARLQATIFGLLPGKLFTIDNYLSLQVDSVCKQGFPEVFDIIPASIEEIVPSYIGNHRLRGRFFEYRREARRR